MLDGGALRYARISIHAPAKGATGHGCLKGFWVVISIHAPAKGATVNNQNIRKINGISIHAPAKGATLQSLAYVYRSSNFNPRTREGCD